MIKLAGAALVILSSCAIGWILAAQVKEQERWLKDVKVSLFLLLGELEYHQMPFPEALCIVGRRHGGYIGPFFEELGEVLQRKEGSTVKELWETKGRKYIKASPLNREQQAEFAELGSYFSETDRQARNNAVTYYLERLEEDIVQLRETGTDKAYLYRTMGMLGGMFLLILVL